MTVRSLVTLSLHCPLSDGPEAPTLFHCPLSDGPQAPTLFHCPLSDGPQAHTLHSVWAEGPHSVFTLTGVKPGEPTLSPR